MDSQTKMSVEYLLCGWHDGVRCCTRGAFTLVTGEVHIGLLFRESSLLLHAGTYNAEILFIL